MKTSLSVDKGQYKSDSTPLLFSECINMYPSIPLAKGGSSGGGLFSWPGQIERASISWVPFDYTVFNGEFYVVAREILSGVKLYKVSSDWTITEVGSLGSLFGSFFRIENNGATCLIINEDSGWFYDETNGLVQITDPVFLGYAAEDQGLQSLTFIDGYFVLNTKTKVFNSSLVSANDGKDFDALDFTQPFLREDCIKVDNIRGDLAVFGENQTKFYSNVGGADFPFQEIPGGTVDRGLENEEGEVRYDDSYFFVGGGENEKLGVWRGVGGGSVSKISTDYIDTEIEKRVSASLSYQAYPRLMPFSIGGRPFLVMAIETAVSDPDDIALAYDLLSSAIKGYPVWIEVQPSVFGETQELLFAEAYGRIVNLAYTGVYELSNDAYGFSQDADGWGKMTFSSAYLQNQSNGLVVNRVELVCETGTGLDRETSLTDTDPQIELQFSDDGARTWRSFGSRSLGKYQKYGTRLVWNRMNRTPTSRIFRFVCDAHIPLRVHRIDVDLKPLRR